MSQAPSNTGTFDRIRQELERWLETARVTGERALDAVGLAADTRLLPPHSDLIETETDLHLLVDLPGVSADAVDLTITGQMLTLRAIRLPSPLLAEGSKVHLRERTTLQFERSYPLPIGVDTDSIRAVVREGMLHVTLHKSPQSQPRPIPIQRGDNATCPPPGT
ncbi:MAG: Hsp20/alpha crystallin family protein [Planctomycetaceae bacterium]|nr:Hsp20/alpha crystallin family protein [Planctomycetaceae bacterium]